MCCCLYIIIQLWIRRCCLAGYCKLYLNSQSYKDRVIEKLGLVSRWHDWSAVVMSQQGFCHWNTFLCDKNYMYDYITTGIIIRHVQMLCLYWLKKYWHQYFGLICWYLQSNPILRINFTLLLQIMSSKSWFEKLPIWPRGIYCCFVSYAQIPLERLQKRQNLHILLKFKRVFSSMYGGKEDVLNCF